MVVPGRGMGQGTGFRGQVGGHGREVVVDGLIGWVEIGGCKDREN